MSVLVDALAVLSSILTALGEFEAARELAEAALPHVRSTLETTNVMLGS